MKIFRLFAVFTLICNLLRARECAAAAADGRANNEGSAEYADGQQRSVKLRKISAKPIGVGAVFQRLIPPGERSGVLTRIERLTAGLQRVSAQLALNKLAPQTALNNQ